MYSENEGRSLTPIVFLSTIEHMDGFSLSRCGACGKSDLLCDAGTRCRPPGRSVWVVNESSDVVWSAKSASTLSLRSETKQADSQMFFLDLHTIAAILFCPRTGMGRHDRH